MKLNLDKIQYRIKNDYGFKKRVRKILLLGLASATIIGVLGIVGIILFSTAIINFLFAHVPGLFEVGFDYVRGFATTYMQDDLTSLLNSFGAGPNVNEMKNLVNQYFNQLSSNSSIDFKSFTNFISTVKNSLLDNQISSAELDLVRQLLLN